MTYEESVLYLESLTSFGIKPGLSRIEALLVALGNPEKKYKTVHITGTNGKGSVAAFLANGILASGVSVAKFTSPHLLSYTERMTVNGVDISEEDFCKALAVVREASEKLVAEGMESPTQFEVLTAMAFWYFAEKEVTYAVIEAGLGGLLDSTNVVTPVVSVITNVTMDHMAYMGDTVEAIAEHKAGIIKHGVPVVTAAQGSALKIIQKKAHKEECRLYTYDKDFAVTSRSKMHYSQMITVEVKDKEKMMLISSMPGLHQSVNMAVAAMAMYVLHQQDEMVSLDGMREGFARTSWPGRFEIVKGLGRTFVFDGAHNAGGAESFAMTYLELFGTKPKKVVFSMLEDKDLSAVVSIAIGSDDEVFAVPAPTPRGIQPEELAKKMPVRAMAHHSVSSGMEAAVEASEEGDIIVVCGSLYILGEARSWLTKKLAQ